LLHDVLYPSFVERHRRLQVSTWLGVSYVHQRIATVPAPTHGPFFETVGRAPLDALLGLGVPTIEPRCARSVRHQRRPDGGDRVRWRTVRGAIERRRRRDQLPAA
jgi:hypothetical protein